MYACMYVLNVYMRAFMRVRMYAIYVGMHACVPVMCCVWIAFGVLHCALYDVRCSLCVARCVLWVLIGIVCCLSRDVCCLLVCVVDGCGLFVAHCLFVVSHVCVDVVCGDMLCGVCC